MKFLGIIPARYESSRFPGKPLADISGKSMIQRVYEQASKSKKISDVVVATDDERIQSHVTSFGGKVLLTNKDHQSGTDRCAEITRLLSENFDVCINIQGDEPFIEPEQIDQLCQVFYKETNTQIATLIKPSVLGDDVKNPNKVKVVINKFGQAIYFSRSPIPFQRNKKQNSNTAYYFHLGIYAYRQKVLNEIVLLPPSFLETTESLEQLRWIENGYIIKTISTNYNPISIDTPADLEKALQHLKHNG